MPNIILKRGWDLQDKIVTPEPLYINRKSFLAKSAQALMGLTLLSCNQKSKTTNSVIDSVSKKPLSPETVYDPNFAKNSFPPKKNKSFLSVPKRKVTKERLASSFNNYYEFSQEKEKVWKLAIGFNTRPWTLTVGGEIGSKKKRTYDLEALVRRFTLEERVYRFRCVEAWAMVVPWIGFPLKKLIRFLEPSSKARYMRFIGWERPEEAPGQRHPGSYSWPYYEALRMDEANNELALVAVGMYGHALTKQNGAPVRLILPWKYGYKSMKGITRIEFVEKKPSTFWYDAAPSEYGFYSNVNPKVPHPRWSQASEQVIGEHGRIQTLPYNGYGKWVSRLYNGQEV